MKDPSRPTATLWVCTCCDTANTAGACTATPAHYREPLALVGYLRLTPGVVCEHVTNDSGLLIELCQCDVREFSVAPCQGCGDTLPGRRVAMTYSPVTTDQFSH